MYIEKLRKEKREKELRVKKLLFEIGYLEEEIKEVENLPMSAEEWHRKQGFPQIDSTVDTENDIVHLKLSDFCSALKNDRISAFEEGEQNDRKRTQPLIDAVKGWLKSECCDTSTYAETLKALARTGISSAVIHIVKGLRHAEALTAETLHALERLQENVGNIRNEVAEVFLQSLIYHKEGFAPGNGPLLFYALGMVGTGRSIQPISFVA